MRGGARGEGEGLEVGFPLLCFLFFRGEGGRFTPEGGDMREVFRPADDGREDLGGRGSTSSGAGAGASVWCMYGGPGSSEPGKCASSRLGNWDVP